jgi:hypothetical protein
MMIRFPRPFVVRGETQAGVSMYCVEKTHAMPNVLAGPTGVVDDNTQDQESRA